MKKDNKTNCPYCDIEIGERSLNRHIGRKHPEKEIPERGYIRHRQL